jgi:NAD(P)-dependent dehydrogenase (short-subunit alcohol dehydrogenase family)
VPTTLITGASRGLGREVARRLAARGYTVLAGARDPDSIPDGVPLDVTDQTTSAALRREVGELDVLVNNAAIHYDTWQSVLTTDLDVVREALETNTLGAWRMAMAFAPLLTQSAHGRLVNAVCPGWVATDMGGPGGRPPAEGAAGIVWAATLPDDGPTGGLFRDGRPVPW